MIYGLNKNNMTYQEIKDKKEKDYNELFTACGVFWAFSNEQFKEGLDKLVASGQMIAGDKLTDIGAGGFMPSKNVQALNDGTKAIDKAFKDAIAEHKQREACILYELNNHEAFYTGTIADTMDALGDEYTKDEVVKVFEDNFKNLTKNY